MVTQASSRRWFLYTLYHRAETYEKHVSYDHRNGDFWTEIVLGSDLEDADWYFKTSPIAG